MKRLFTLVAAVVAVLAVNAEQSVKNASTWSAWNAEMTTIDESGHFTFNEAWSGAGFWLGVDEDDDGVTDFWTDWSDYDVLVYVVADAQGSFNLSIEYHDDADPSNNHATSGTIGTNGYGYVLLNADYSDYVAQTWIQPTGAPSSITITDMVLMTTDEFEAFKEKMKPTGDKVNLWTGEMEFNTSWPSIGIGADAFSIASAGDRMIVTISEVIDLEDWEWGAQIFCNNFAWRSIDGMKAEGITEAGEVTFTLTQAQLDTIAATGGMYVQGMECKVTSIDLLRTGGDLTGDVLWEGTQVFDNSWPGIQGMGPEKFARAQVGDKIVVTVASVDDLEGWEWGAQLLWKDGSTWDTLAGTETTNVTAAGDVALVINEQSLAALQANGLILGGIACTVSKIMLVYDAAHVDNTVVNPAGKDEIFNLSGQRVDENYKGIVVSGGKKYLKR